jgi:hypothetical protein
MHNESDKCNCHFLAGTLNSRNSKFQKKILDRIENAPQSQLVAPNGSNG